MKETIYTGYSNDLDITVILKDTFDKDDEIVSTEIVGWYYGTPAPKLTKEYLGNLKAIFTE